MAGALGRVEVVLPIVTRWVRELRRDRSGVTALEYALMAGLIGVALIGSLSTLAHSLTVVFSTVSVHL